MLKLLNNEIDNSNFTTAYIYNDNRSKGSIRERIFIDFCFEHRILEARKYLISKSIIDIQRGKEYELFSFLSDYPRENQMTLRALFYICKKYKDKLDIVYKKSLKKDKIEAISRIFINDYKLAINPSTQSIEELMALLLQNVNVCIVDYFLGEGVVGYLINKTDKYNEAYQAYELEKQECIRKELEMYWSKKDFDFF